MLKNSLHPKPSKLTQFFIRLRQVFFQGSRNYWEKRYSMGGNSGKGSYGESAEFKSDILNNFVHDNNISSVTEYGCGNGNQLRYAEYPQYIGLDISEQAVELSGELFAKDPSKHFSIYDPDEFEINKQRFTSDLVLSLDVIYHLVEDEVYRKYLQNIFNSAKRYVVIYSSNEEVHGMLHSRHVRHRNFASDIAQWFPSWEVKEVIKNRVLQDQPEGKEPSVDFFILQFR
jgi:cyclopropane fatty-acyl-phospholipid synthase-like methyltransferase